MNVLLVAPPSDLEYATAELQRISNLLKPDLLVGAGASIDAFSEKVNRKKYDIVWFAAHGDDEGIYLYDGVLTPNDMIQSLRDSMPTVFVNTCNSLLTVLHLHDRLGLPVIGTISKIEDRVAYTTASLFAKHLAGGKSVRESYNLSKPADSQFVFFNGDMQTSSNRTRDETFVMVALIDKRLKSLEETVDRFLSLLESVDDECVKKPTRGEAPYIFVGSTMFVVASLMLFSEFREAVGLSGSAISAALMVIFASLGIYFLTRSFQ